MTMVSSKLIFVILTVAIIVENTGVTAPSSNLPTTYGHKSNNNYSYGSISSVNQNAESNSSSESIDSVGQNDSAYYNPNPKSPSRPLLNENKKILFDLNQLPSELAIPDVQSDNNTANSILKTIPRGKNVSSKLKQPILASPTTSESQNYNPHQYPDNEDDDDHITNLKL